MTEPETPRGYMVSYFKNGRWEYSIFRGTSPEDALETARQRKWFAVGHRLGPPPGRRHNGPAKPV